jgi:chromosome partition protein MukE
VTRTGHAALQDVLLDDDFPDLDLALRRGRHVDRDDGGWYALLTDAQEHLEAFYRRYGCELIHKSDGYYYLLPTSDKLPRRQLAAGDMLVGQALALLYLDPASVERGGVITREDVVAQLAAVLGSDALIRAYNPKRRKYDERVAQKTVRNKVAEAVRRLAGLGFVDAVDEDKLRLRPALLRFAEPVRGLGAPAEALARLVAEGEVAIAEEGAEDGEESESESDSETETETETETEAETEAETDPPADPEPSADRAERGSALVSKDEDSEDIP